MPKVVRLSATHRAHTHRTAYDDIGAIAIELIDSALSLSTIPDREVFDLFNRQQFRGVGTQLFVIGVAKFGLKHSDERTFAAGKIQYDALKLV